MADSSRSTRQATEEAARYKAECRELDAPCWLCGQLIDYDADGQRDDYAFHLDHYWPWSTHKELRFDPDNYRPSHRICNITRGDEPPRPGIGATTRDWLGQAA